jgi:hypothetical protein
MTESYRQAMDLKLGAIEESIKANAEHMTKLLELADKCLRQKLAAESKLGFELEWVQGDEPYKLALRPKKGGQ